MRQNRLMVTLFSVPSITLNDRPIHIPYRKAEALFFYLMIRKQATRAEVCALLWGESDDSLALKNLRNALYNLKKCFRLDVIITPNRTLLQVNPEIFIDNDVWRFLDGRDPGLYRGTFLSGFDVQNANAFEEWLTETRSSLRDAYLRMLFSRFRELMAAESFDEAEKCAVAYLQEEPYDEEFVSLLMEQYGQRHLHHKAIKAYQKLCTRLEEDLGIAPLKETVRLYHQIIEERNRMPSPQAEDDIYLPSGQLALYQGVVAAMQNRGKAFGKASGMFVMGESGVGKTYLLDFLLDNMVFEDTLLLTSACYRSESASVYAPWQGIILQASEYLSTSGIEIPLRWLEPVTRFFGAFADDASSIVRPNEGGDIFNSRAVSDGLLMMLSKIAGQTRVILVFEDVHWMDRFSLSLLAQVFRKLHGENVLVLCTCRTPPGALCEQVIRQLQDDQLAVVRALEPFTPQEVKQLAEHLSQRQLSADTLEYVYHETRGNALLLVQYLSTWREGGGDLPACLQDILAYRLAGLDQTAHQVLDIISLFPDHAPYELLEAMMSKTSLELLYLCDDLKRRMIICSREAGGALYLAFSHQRFQELVYRGMSPLNRRILHLRVARLLEQLPVGCAFNATGRIIYHYRMGGDRQNAFRLELLCLDAYISHHCEVMCIEAQPGFSYQAVSPGASSDIVADYATQPGLYRYFETMLRKLDELRGAGIDSGWLDEQRAFLLYTKGRACIYSGKYREGIAAIQVLLEPPHPCRNPLVMLRAHRQMIFYGIQTYRPDIMRCHLEAGFQLAGQVGNPVETAIHYRLQGLYHMMCGEYGQSERFLRQSLEMLSQLDRSNERYVANIAYAHNYLGDLQRRQLNFEDAAEAYERAVSISHSDEFTGTALFLANYGQAAFALGDHKRARESFLRAGDLYERCWNLNGRSLTCAYLAFYDAGDGNEQAALRRLQDALRFMELYGSPLEQGIVYSIMALLKQACQGGPVAVFLSEPFSYYRERGLSLLETIPGAYEINILSRYVA